MSLFSRRLVRLIKKFHTNNYNPTNIKYAFVGGVTLCVCAWECVTCVCVFNAVSRHACAPQNTVWLRDCTRWNFA